MNPYSRNCLIIMPFTDQQLNAHYEKVIKPTVVDAGYNCFRVDEVSNGTYAITPEIVKRIEEAHVILGNIAHLNPNVFYELGMAHSFGNNVLLIAEKGQRIPFDLLDYNIFMYSYTSDGDADLKNFLRNSLLNLSWTMTENNPIQAYSNRLKRLLEFSNFRGEITDNSHVAKEIVSCITTEYLASTSGFNIIAVSGAVAMGKTTFCKLLQQCIQEVEGKNSCSIVPLDNYMVPRSVSLQSSTRNGFHDENWDIQRMKYDLQRLINGEEIQVKEYNHKTGRHFNHIQTVKPTKFIILDGLISFHPEISELSTFKIYIGHENIIDEQNLRIEVSYNERGYTLRNAINQADKEFKDYSIYLRPRSKEADVWVVIENDKWRYRLEYEYPFNI